ncbi:MAG: acyltransferase domain-containing protein, partial [Chloroflexales bacterium]|nr:acyltransferase domain-containing protein [Chloroflexales bacterium]
QQIDRYATLSALRAMAAGRIAHILGCHGPVMQVDTACSSSLLAIHLACQSLRANECGLALAGGVSLMLGPEGTIALCQMQTLAPDGRSKAFDAKADGFARGEGCGVIVLKRLSDAVRDGDPILALVRGSAVNHDGRSRTVTTPNGLAQQELLGQALRNARVSAEQIQYVEAHGTGTSLGDPIEILALAKVFGARREAPLAIGSVKSNLGHLDAAAGVAGLMKVVLGMQHGAIPPSLHLHEPNPRLPWRELPLVVPTTLSPWEGRPRMAGLSSFGLSGTNVHLIIEEPPPEPGPRPSSPLDRPRHLLALSATSEGALRDLAARYEAALAADAQIDAGDVCFTAAVGRTHFEHRLALHGETGPQLAEQLAAFVDGRELTGAALGCAQPREQRRLAFLFTGQGCQYVGMGRELYMTQPRFRATLEACDEILRDHLGESLLDVLYPDLRGASPHDSRADLLSQTAYTQPAIFVIEYALADLWQSWGVLPNVVMGHSLGEYAAACCAGVFSLEDGLRLVATRGRLAQALAATGAMAALQADEATVAEVLRRYEGEVSLAALNGPGSLVISGIAQAVQSIVEELSARGLKARKLAIAGAFHSPLIEPMMAPFRAAARAARYAPPRIPLVSNVTGGLAGDEVADPEYWVRHLRQPVRFAEGMATLSQQGCALFVEPGPLPTLLGMGRACLPEGAGAWLPSLRADRPDWQQMLQSLGELYVRGVEVDWGAFERGYQRRKVALPTYPFQRQRCWVDLAPTRSGGAVRPLVDTLMRLPLLDTSALETMFSVAALPYLAEHAVFGQLIAPGACQLAMVLNGADELYPRRGLALEDVAFPKALAVPPGEGRRVQALLKPAATGAGAIAQADIQVISLPEHDGVAAEPQTHSVGRLVIRDEPGRATVSLDALRGGCQEEVDPAALYSALEARQIALGPSFRWLERVWRGEAEVLGRLRMPQAIAGMAGHVIHPGLLDACFQLTGALDIEDGAAETMIPFGLKALRVYGPVTGQAWWGHARRAGRHSWDISLLDATGQLIAAVEGFELRAAMGAEVAQREPWRQWLYEVGWQRQPHYGLRPDYLPHPEQMGQALTMGLHQLQAQHEHELRLYAEAHAALSALTVEHITAALARLGLSLRRGSRHRLEQVAAQLRVIPQHRRLLGRLFGVLAEAQVLRRDGDEWVVERAPEGASGPTQAHEAALLARYGQVAAPELSLVGRCGASLAEVLRGSQDPVALLFGGGDSASRLYRDAPPFRMMNSLVQQAVSAAIAGLPAGRGLRVLEIGAGTGGTTAYLLPAMPDGRAEYLFTDVGAGFLAEARQRFGGYGFVRYQSLDIERDPGEQGFAPHQHDIVIAANVLHATQDIRQTLVNARRLLAPDGLLVLLEVTGRSSWVDITFGLTEGWWRFKDLERRPDYPLLAPEQWSAALLEAGFQHPTWVAPDAEAGVRPEQAVVIAQAGPAEVAPGGEWLILADRAGVGEALAAALRERGQPSTLAFAGAAYAELAGGALRIDSESPADYGRALKRVGRPRGVVHLWGLDQRAGTSAELASASRHGLGSCLSAVQALLQSYSEPPALWVVTSGAQAAAPGDSVGGVEQAALWGMGQVVALEYPDLRGLRIDLDRELCPAAHVEGIRLSALPRLFFHPHKDFQIVQDQIFPSGEEG